MARNIEIKARIADPIAVRRQIESLGAEGPEELIQTDTFFNVPHGRLKLREFGGSSGELIFYERANVSGPKLSEYVRIPVSDAKLMCDALARALGLQTTVRKRRAVFLVGQSRVHVDDVEELGSFLEFEVVLRQNQSVAEGERIASDLMNALSISPADLVAGAYADLIAANRLAGVRVEAPLTGTGAGDLVRQFYQRIWNEGDLSAISELLATDVRFRGSLGNETSGRDPFRAYVRSVRGALADYRCEILALVSEGNRAFAQMRFSGRHVGTFRGYEPTGKMVEWLGAALFLVVDEMISEVWVLGDLTSLDSLLTANREASDD
jgi:predicted adenylyl cyclase CyaB